MPPAPRTVHDTISLLSESTEEFLAAAEIFEVSDAFLEKTPSAQDLRMLYMTMTLSYMQVNKPLLAQAAVKRAGLADASPILELFGNAIAYMTEYNYLNAFTTLRDVTSSQYADEEGFDYAQQKALVDATLDSLASYHARQMSSMYPTVSRSAVAAQLDMTEEKLMTTQSRVSSRDVCGKVNSAALVKAVELLQKP